MDDLTRQQLGNVLLFVLTLAHALSTWPPAATVALFAGGTGVAFLLETTAVRVGMLRHNYRPQVASVPVSILLAWPAVVYLFYRSALLVAPAGAGAAAVAAVAATLVDAVTDPILLSRGAWEYPEWVLSEPRFRGVPWWNFVGWLAITFVTALLPTLAVA